MFIGTWLYHNSQVYRRSEIMALARTMNKLSDGYNNIVSQYKSGDDNIGAFSTFYWKTLSKQKMMSQTGQANSADFVEEYISDGNHNCFVFLPTWVGKQSYIIVVASKSRVDEERHVLGSA